MLISLQWRNANHRVIFVVIGFLTTLINGCYSQDITGEYKYDENGRLTADHSEGIINIEWNHLNKITRIQRADTCTTPDLEFKYDVDGNRVMKIVKPRTGRGISAASHWKYTLYRYDNYGTLLSVYELNYEQTGVNEYKETLKINEQNIYGADRIGYENFENKELICHSFTADINSDGEFVNVESKSILTPAVSNDMDVAGTRGTKLYAQANHLGDVLSVVSNRKTRTPEGTFTTDLVSANHYYPGGMISDSYQSSRYRYGFNKGAEKVDEVSGEGNHFTTFFREGDTRLLRWWSKDPKASSLPWQSPYSFMDNNPILKNDPDGDIAVVDDLVIGFLKGLVRGEDPFERALQDATNSAKIWGGLFAVNTEETLLENVGQVLSRFTWELPQTALGLVAAQSINTFGNVDEVVYYDGATISVGGVILNPFSLGSYIGLFRPWEDSESHIGIGEGSYIFMHEYGHYLQSRNHGPFYLPFMGIPSLFADDFAEGDASREAAEYFERKDPQFYWDIYHVHRYKDKEKFRLFYFPNEGRVKDFQRKKLLEEQRHKEFLKESGKKKLPQ